MSYTLLLFYISAFLTIIYWYICPNPRDESPSPTQDSKLHLEEYRTLNNEIERRERSMIMMGSIFLPVSFLLLGQAAMTTCSSARLLLVYASVLLYGAWLLAVQYTSWWLDEITYARIRGIESQEKFEVHRYVRNSIRMEYFGTFRIWFRRHHWALFLILLSAVAILVLGIAGL